MKVLSVLICTLVLSAQAQAAHFYIEGLQAKGLIDSFNDKRFDQFRYFHEGMEKTFLNLDTIGCFKEEMSEEGTSMACTFQGYGRTFTIKANNSVNTILIGTIRMALKDITKGEIQVSDTRKEIHISNLECRFGSRYSEIEYGCRLDTK